jgi:uncharacterized protein YecE (DUF72 family)
MVTVMLKWWIGCSGFHYKHWKEIFYPHGLAQKKWFEFYCQFFNTLELNVTFYRFPQLSFLESWYNRSPDEFSFSVKAPRAITHYKKFTDCDELIASFYSTIKEGLKDKLGCVLFQLPPRTSYTEERLDKIINSLDDSFTNVLEFRHESWWNTEVYRKLTKHNISFSGMSHPSLPDDIIQNMKTLYYRMHGVPELYKSPYTLSQLKKIVDEISGSGKTRTAYIYFNNDIGGSAIMNAKQMIQYALKLNDTSAR